MPKDPLATWHQLVRAQSPEGLEALLAEDVRLFSPVVHTPQLGKETALRSLSAIFRVFRDGHFRYVRELAGPHDAALEFEVELDGVLINGIDLLRWNDEGLLTEFKVMVRPLQAIKVLHAKLSAAL